MTKGEFLMTLRTKLTGEILPQEVERTILYYDNYISNAVRDGKTEEQVLSELGDPLLIAKTIVDTQGHGGNRVDSYRDRNDYGTGYSYGNEKPQKHFHVYRVHPWLAWFIGILLIFLLLTVLRMLLPIVLPLLLVYILISLIRRK